MIACCASGVLAASPVAFERVPAKLNLHLNGVTWHIQRRGLNEENWGLGFDLERYRSESEHGWLDGWMIAHEADVFLGSHRHWGGSVGFSARKAWGRWCWFGLNAGLIHQHEYQRDFGVPVLPFVLPFLETRTRSPVNFRLTYCPPVDRSFHVLMLQCVIAIDHN